MKYTITITLDGRQLVHRGAVDFVAEPGRIKIRGCEGFDDEYMTTKERVGNICIECEDTSASS